MSKKFHPFIALCLLFLFSFLLAESGLHALLHADLHAHLGEPADHHAGCNHSDADLTLDEADEVCNLCSEFTVNAAYAISPVGVRSHVFSKSFLTTLSCALAQNPETKLNPTRGPPVA